MRNLEVSSNRETMNSPQSLRSYNNPFSLNPYAPAFVSRKMISSHQEKVDRPVVNQPIISHVVASKTTEQPLFDKISFERDYLIENILLQLPLVKLSLYYGGRIYGGILRQIVFLSFDGDKNLIEKSMALMAYIQSRDVDISIPRDRYEKFISEFTSLGLPYKEGVNPIVHNDSYFGKDKNTISLLYRKDNISYDITFQCTLQREVDFTINSLILTQDPGQKYKLGTSLRGSLDKSCSLRGSLDKSCSLRDSLDKSCSLRGSLDKSCSLTTLNNFNLVGVYNDIRLKNLNLIGLYNGSTIKSSSQSLKLIIRGARLFNEGWYPLSDTEKFKIISCFSSASKLIDSTIPCGSFRQRKTGQRITLSIRNLFTPEAQHLMHYSDPNSSSLLAPEYKRGRRFLSIITKNLESWKRTTLPNDYNGIVESLNLAAETNFVPVIDLILKSGIPMSYRIHSLLISLYHGQTDAVNCFVKYGVTINKGAQILNYRPCWHLEESDGRPCGTKIPYVVN